jgi:parallel beta-helix repeat protein
MRNANGTLRPAHAPNVAPNLINVVTRAAQLGYSIELANSEHDDNPGIQAVISDAATIAGSTLYFPNGTYNLNSFSALSSTVHLVMTKSGVNLKGESRDGTVFLSSQDAGTGSTNYYGIRLLGVNNVVLKNFTFTNSWNKKFSTSTSTNNPDRGGLSYVIATGYGNSTPAFNITIDNVLVEKFIKMGVRIAAGSYDVVVKNSIARNATDVAGGGAGYGFVIQGSTHSSATTNPFSGDAAKDTYFVTLDGNKTEGEYIRHAVIIQYWAHNNLVTNNEFVNNQLDAIDLHGEDEYANEISYNTVINSYRAGIALGNSGAGHDKSGVDNWIHHNDLIGCNWGISVQYGTAQTTIENNTIRDNTSNAISSPRGIWLGNSDGYLVRNNTISNNTVAGFFAIALRDDSAEGESPAGGPKNWIIDGNTVTNSGTELLNNSNYSSGNSIQTSW